MKNRLNISRFIFCFSFAIALACNNDDDAGAIYYAPDPVTQKVELSTNKGAYMPGEAVQMKADKMYSNAMIRYSHLGTTISEEPFTATSWTWTPPSDDFKGYMVEVYVPNSDGTNTVLGTTAVDVSSDWAKFPRYGFLSEYGNNTESERTAIIDNLTKFHINGLQFYDWMYRQHQPLAGSVSNPMPVWNDIINRDNYKTTVESYIAKAHEKNMKAMFYNLAYGVLDDYNHSLITPQMFIYKDANHNTIDFHPLAAPFISNIYLTNPANTDWQNYLAQQNNDVYQVFDFDGYHIDQLGDRGNVYNYGGTGVDLKNTFAPFIAAMKTAHPNKHLLFNAVNQFGQQQMANESLDFLYSEVWSPNEGFKDLTKILSDNATYSNNTKNTVLAAYMNYNKANGQGVFNTPGVLLADAVIFAFGGSHLELGEHMLAKEYFPNKNLSMTAELKSSLAEYYDFLVAYQNLLRDGGAFNEPVVSTGDGKINVGSWPPSMGKVSVVGKQVGAKQVVHLLNFTNANSLNWRDTDGNQNTPTDIKQAVVNIKVNGTVNKVWYASPDTNGGAAVALTYTQNGNSINLKIPFLKYWGMIVIE
ncbi:endo-dextranase [Flavobacterium caeni]|uniref:Dextranase n=1 Tax=Flavobacterium caeni TaxID=490189 RepID=A0A1G5JWT5_9FLAO|nr:glycoside hydrolase family 66 protein [Flavobacterium caeni]SCY92815.1 dextranase [Flavobacterium caeni]